MKTRKFLATVALALTAALAATVGAPAAADAAPQATRPSGCC